MLDDRILELLEQFRQMTRAQMLIAGIGANLDYLGERLRLLEKQKLIHSTHAGVNFGKVPYLYSLASAGAEALAERWKISRHKLHYYRQRPRISASQFSHRQWCINAHVIAVRTLGESLVSWIPEYGGASGVGGAPTLLQLAHGGVIRPDAVFAVDHGERGKMAYALEVHASTGAQTSRLIDQLKAHQQAQGTRLVSGLLGLGLTYSSARDYVTLLALPDDATRASLRRRLKTDREFENTGSWLRCKTYPELEAGFQDWKPLLEAV